VDYGDSSGLPNFVLILADDQGWSQSSTTMDPSLPEGASGYLETPNLERLAQAGMRFSNAYAPAPFCTPTRRSILCGTNAAHSGPEFIAKWVPADHLTIPRALKSVHPDYRTAHFGKWGAFMASHPTKCGYDVSDGDIGNKAGGTPRAFGLEGGHFDVAPYFIDNEDPKRTFTVTERAIAFMHESVEDERPFFMQVSYFALHLSVMCKQKTLDKYEAKGLPDRGYSQAYAAMVEELDMGVGRLLDAIDAEGIGGNTYVIYTSDNGGRDVIPGGTERANNTPLRGAKHDLYEGGLRVPLVVRGPGIAAGSLSATPVVGYDFLPTFYDLAGGEGGLTPEIDGVSFKILLTQPGASLPGREDGTLFFHRPKLLLSAIRRGDDKLVLHWNFGGQVESRELFHLDQDLSEAHNLLADSPELAQGLEHDLLAYLAKVKSPMSQDYAPDEE